MACCSRRPPPPNRPRAVLVVVVVVVVVVLTSRAGPADGARILAVQLYGGKSHWNFLSAVLRSLTEAGHHVTAFTPFPDGDRENYTELDTSGRLATSVGQDVTAVVNGYGPPAGMTAALVPGDRKCCDTALGDRRLGEMLLARADDGRPRFDAVVVEPLTVDCASYMAHALRAPLIHAVPSPMLTFAERSLTGHVSNPAGVSHLFARHAVPDTFGRRFANVALLAYTVLKVRYDAWRARLADPRPYDSAPTVRPSVIFQNSHHVTESARPVPPNVVDVGGVHLRPAKRIPKDILDFIEDSPDGIIYFTFGSTIKLSSFPKHIEKVFKEVLSKVPQKVLWKYEIEMNDLPKNVMVKKWFPQREILLHPNVKLFICHGGISGVYEAVDGGVPMLGFPVFYDQPRNMDHLVRAGMAITMDLLSVSEETLHSAISELINNEKYVKNAKIASNIFKDRPMTPAQSVVYWTEYVIRHKGAPHLKSHAVNLTWYQYFLLDVIGVVLIVVILITFLMYKALKCMCFCIFKSSNNNKKKIN